jgi:hypothetical protein
VVAAPQQPFEGDVQHQSSPTLLPPPAGVDGKAVDAGLVPARVAAIETERLECLEIDHGSSFDDFWLRKSRNPLSHRAL